MTDLRQALLAAQAARDDGRWNDAISLFSTALASDPGSAQIRHNLALCCFGSGRLDDALNFARQATAIRPDLWQSRMVEAKVHRVRGAPAKSETALDAILRGDPRNPTALAAMADLDINEFGDPAAAVSRLATLAGSVDAELTALMAGLYLGEDSPETQSARLKSFSARELRIAPVDRSRRLARGRRRIGLISKLFSASPVYFLTFSAFESLSKSADLICFNRGTNRDWATERFVNVAADWHDVAHHEPTALAQAIADAEVDILFDLGGWTDAPALAALSARPAPKMFSWVGGQSATTGLDQFDGWIGDEWQSPQALSALYSEPLLNIEGGYCDYRPPDYLGQIKIPSRRTAIGLVGNPCKIVPSMFKAWPRHLDHIVLIDRRYAHARTRERVTSLLSEVGVDKVDIVVPNGHVEYLQALARMKAIVNTRPYSGGLTLVEAMALGVEVIELPGEGGLFCERHHLAHRHSGGRNPRLADQIAGIVGT